MSLIQLSHALRPRRSLWRKLLLSLVASVAIVIGLVAMHSLNLEGGHSAAVSSLSPAAAAVDHHGMVETGAAATPAGVADCDGACEHSLMVMACILALMVTVIVLAASRSTMSREHHRRAAAPLMELRATLAPVTPPSLVVLSISRT